MKFKDNVDNIQCHILCAPVALEDSHGVQQLAVNRTRRPFGCLCLHNLMTENEKQIMADQRACGASVPDGCSMWDYGSYVATAGCRDSCVEDCVS